MSPPVVQRELDRTTTASSRFRVAHVALQLDTGGMERLLTDFARHADTTRYELMFVSLTTRGPMAAAIEQAGCRVHALEAAQGIRPGMVLALARLFRQTGVSVVHLHNTRPLLYAGPAARLARVPVVVHTRHGQRINATQRQHQLCRLASRAVDRMVCVSHDSQRLAIAEGVHAARTSTIWNGVDARLWKPSHEPSGPAVFLGRLSAEKDLTNLIDAVALVAAQRPRFRLRMAGDGPCRDQLTSLIQDRSLTTRVELLGEVKDVASVLNGASMFVLPSKSEGMPLTVLEAMAAGLPVVATRVGGVPEVVLGGRTGLLVPPSSPEHLAQAMLTILDHPARAAQFGMEGRRRLEAHFDVRTMVAQYELLYESLLREAQAVAA